MIYQTYPDSPTTTLPPRLRLFVGALPMGLNSAKSRNGGRRRNGLLSAHWTEYQAAKKSWATLLMSSVPHDFPGFGSHLLGLRVVRFGPAPLDRDNLWASMKMVFDGLKHAGVIPDDNERCVPFMDVRQVIELNDSRQGLTIDVWPLSLQEIQAYEAVRRQLAAYPRPRAGSVFGEFSP